MKKKWFVLVALLLFVAAGCSNKAYDEAMQKGIDALENEKYEEAVEFFEQALAEKKDDEQAEAYLKQTKEFINANKKFEEGKLEEAVDALKRVIEMEGGSDTLVERAKKLQEQADELNEKLVAYEEAYEQAKAQFDNEKYKESIQILDKQLQEDLSHPVFASIKQKVEALLETAKENEQKRAEEEKRRKEEEQAKKEAEKQRNQTVEKFFGYWVRDDKRAACHIAKTYWACAVAESDVMFRENITSITGLNESQVKIVSQSGYSPTLQLKGNNTMVFEGETYHRASQKEANAVYSGYYKLP